ncbi:MAG: hypothetical protein M1832_006211 [Thelocarpon impressellum]|nr:MAG: hypothetical protein M1832_006211 [Thelocarpon impressellum]
MPSQDSPSRPSFAARSASSPSFALKDRGKLNGHAGQALANGTPPSASHRDRPTQHKSHSHSRPHAHVVGHNRAHGHQPRVPSYSKNLSKLSKLTQARDGDGGPVAGGDSNHRRSRSHTPSSSPRSTQFDAAAVIARNRSEAALPANSSRSGLKKNGSRVSLKRNASSKDVAVPRSLRSEKHGRASFSQQRERRPNRQQSVHFDLGSEGQDYDLDQDEGWTEVSNSESPTITRPPSQASSRPSASTELPPTARPEPRPVSPTKEADHCRSRKDSQESRDSTESKDSQESKESRDSQDTKDSQESKDSQQSLTRRDETQRHVHTNGHNSTNHASPDPKAITARLLQRQRHNAPPQMSTVSATGSPLNHSPRSITHSQASTVNGQASTVDSTPGNRENVVSRFIGDGSDGGTANGSISPSHQRHVPNSPTPRKAMPSSPPEPSLLGATRSSNASSSRTQQKLNLQRASSNIESQQLRPGGAGMSLYGDGPRDPRAQRLLERSAIEYNVVRRARHPLLDAVGRLQDAPGLRRMAGVGVARGSEASVSQSSRPSILNRTASARSKDSAAERPRAERPSEARRAEAEEAEHVDQILRRMWERQEGGQGD